MLAVRLNADLERRLTVMAKRSGRSKSDVVRDLLIIGLKKPPTSAYRDLVMDAIAAHEKRFHATEKTEEP